MSGLRVSVYFNLHRRLWSVRAEEGAHKGLVVAHARHVTLRNASGKVSAAGRDRVLREGRKNVHAFMRGELYGLFEIVSVRDGADLGLEQWQVLGPCCLTGDYRDPVRVITYNPYKYSTFVDKASEAEYTSSEWAVLGSYLGPTFELNTRTVTVKG